MTSISLENLPANVSVRQPKQKMSVRETLTAERVARIGSVTITPRLVPKVPVKILPKVIRPPKDENDERIEIEILDYDEQAENLIEDENHRSSLKRSASSENSLSPSQLPKKTFIQFEVLNDHEVSDGGDILHENQAIVKVHEVESPLKKNFSYDSTKYPRSVVDKFHETNKITVRRRDPPGPALKFDDVNFNANIKTELETRGFKKPTALQSVVWPVALSGFDVIAVAGSNTGWTLSYLLPAIIHINNLDRTPHADGPAVLIIASGEDSVINIYLTAENFLRHEISNVWCTTELESLRDLVEENQGVGCDIMIATAQEVIELLKEELIDLNRCSYLVIDDIGVESRQQIEEIFEKTQKDTQILAKCKQMTKSLLNYLDKFMNDYVRIGIET